MIGKTLNNRFKVTAELGTGAMGKVYRATDLQTNQEVALKVMAEQLTFDIAMLERFRREGEALRQLRHPNIVGFIDTFQHEGQQIICLEYVPGGSLHELTKRGPLPLDRARRIALELCDALTRAHHLNIIHRDLKPENILIAGDGAPRLTDFGVARLVSEGTRLTGTGTQVGTPYYMAPEAWQGQHLDAQADIWSLGVVLYEMLGGQVPFGGDTVVAVMNRVLTAPLPDLKPLRPDVPDGLVKIIRKMLTRDKAKRYQTMREVALDLERVTSESTLAGETRKEAAPAAGPRPRRGLVIGGVIVGAVVVVGCLAGMIALGAWALSQGNAAQATQNAQAAELRASQTALAAALAPTKGPKPTTSPVPTQAPAPTAAPLPTEAPAAPPTAEPAFTGDSLAAPTCDYGGELKSVEALDRYTVQFKLCYPDAAFASKVAFAAFPILSQAQLNRTGGDSAAISDQPIGTGPYVVKEWVRGDHLTFEAYPEYWGEPAKTKTLVFRWPENTEARVAALLAGEADGIDNPPSGAFATIGQSSQLKLYPRQALNIFYIGLNNTIRPLDNEKVRQAIAMAIDRGRIVEDLYPAGSSAAEQFVPPAMKPGYSDSGEGARWYDYDVDRAKQLLREAGYPDGFEITLTYRDAVRSYLPRGPEVARDIQDQLGQVGIRVTLDLQDSGEFLNNAADGRLAMFLLGWLADYPDASNFYDYHFVDAGRFGDVYPDLAAEIRAAASLADPAQRQRHYDAANALIKQHVPVVPVAHAGSATAFSARVAGAYASPLSNEYFAAMAAGKDQLVWLQAAEPMSLYCADETDGDTFRACEQVYESLLSYQVGGTEVQPGLAQSYEVNADLTTWTFRLREGVTFHDGARLTANDVVASYAAQWDVQNPNHRGSTGAFEYFVVYFGAFLNAPR